MLFILSKAAFFSAYMKLRTNPNTLSHCKAGYCNMLLKNIIIGQFWFPAKKKLRIATKFRCVKRLKNYSLLFCHPVTYPYYVCNLVNEKVYNVIKNHEFQKTGIHWNNTLKILRHGISIACTFSAKCQLFLIFPKCHQGNQVV